MNMATERKNKAKAVIDSEVARVKKIVDSYGPLSPEDQKSIEEGKKIADGAP